MELTHRIAGLETLKVGGSTYTNTWHFHTSSADGQYVEEFWEAPGVGNVKAVIRNPGGTITLTLREFNPGPETP
jgi:hypothetical protein